jgi:lipoprotein-releasing system permease protein
VFCGRLLPEGAIKPGKLAYLGCAQAAFQGNRKIQIQLLEVVQHDAALKLSLVLSDPNQRHQSNAHSKNLLVPLETRALLFILNTANAAQPTVRLPWSACRPTDRRPTVQRVNCAKMSLTWLLALSHLKRRQTQNLLSVLGVAVGVMVLTTALSLTNGFVSALFDSTIKAQPHIELNTWQTNLVGVPPDPALEARLKSTPEVVGWSPYLTTQALLTRRAGSGRGGAQLPAQVYGVQPKLEVGALNLNPGDRERLETLPVDGILLGRDLARSLGALAGDTVFVVTSSGDTLSESRRQAFTVMGTFTTGNFIIDNVLAFTHLEPLQRLRDATGLISGYHVRLNDPELAPRFANLLPTNLNGQTGATFTGTPWQEKYRNIVDSMNLQKQVIGAVLTLIVVVAAFGMVNVFLLTVFQKTQEIAILRAIGASTRLVQGVFLLKGLVLGGIGLVVGNILGLALSYYFVWQPFRLPGDLFFISALPAQPKLGDFLWVSAVSILATACAAFIPARLAARVEPAKIIR